MVAGKCRYFEASIWNHTAVYNDKQIGVCWLTVDWSTTVNTYVRLKVLRDKKETRGHNIYLLTRKVQLAVVVALVTFYFHIFSTYRERKHHVMISSRVQRG